MYIIYVVYYIISYIRVYIYKLSVLMKEPNNRQGHYLLQVASDA